MPDRRWLTWLAWIAALLTVGLFSVYGRGLQRIARSTIGGGPLAWVIGAATVVAATAAVSWLWRRRGLEAVLHATWLGPLALLLPALYPIVEERIHFVLFGLVGFLTARLFPPASALAISILVAALDEALQAFLPDRFADWRDVGMNGLSSLVGAFIAMRASAGDRPARGGRASDACPTSASLGK